MKRDEIKTAIDAIVGYIHKTYTPAQVVKAMTMIITNIPAAAPAVRGTLAPKLGVNVADLQAETGPTV